MQIGDVISRLIFVVDNTLKQYSPEQSNNGCLHGQPDKIIELP